MASRHRPNARQHRTAWLVATLVLAALPAEASAGVSFEANVKPDPIVFPETRELTYELRMSSDVDGASFTVDAVTPPTTFRNQGRGFYRRLTMVRPVGGSEAPPELTGSGTVSVTRKPPPPIPLPAPYPPWDIGCFRGYGFYGFDTTPGYLADVNLPPDSSATLSFAFNTGRAAPWPGTDYRVAFRITGLPEHPSGLIIGPPQPHAGESGVKIVLSASAGRRTRGRHRLVTVEGTTDPPAPHDRIAVERAVIMGDPRSFARRSSEFRRIAIVDTDARGRFRLEWEARRHRFYKLRALYDNPNPGLAADGTCPQYLRRGQLPRN